VDNKAADAAFSLQKGSEMKRVWTFVVPMAALVAALAFMQHARADDKAKNMGSIKGAVLGEDGKAAANVNVRLLPPRQQGNRPPATQPVSPQVAPGDAPKGGPDGGTPPAPPPGQGPGQGRGRPQPIKTAVTDADGKFTMDEVPPGEYRLVAGERGQAVGMKSVTVKAGEAVSVEIKLAPPRPPQ
jgi:hypothetical protein